MDATQSCPICGTPVNAGAPQGLCPQCLMKSGFETRRGNESKTPFVPPPVDEIAKLFPQLEIIGLLGCGGMGAVYKSRQPRLNRFVALKILSPEKQNNPQFAERFEREARALAALTHPNIVMVYDFGDVRGIFYLLMEFVDGLTLRQLYQTRKLSAVEALGIVPKICEALQYAHEQGIVHRDIKPENILLDKKGQVKIADFGIAKILDPAAKDLTLTGAKDVVGTVHYMAPEQIEKPQTVDARADIYSLGVVFYEMLTGELPLGNFQPPSQKVQIDVRLDQVVLHALEKEPERRYQKASEVKTDVETIATTMTTNPPPQIPAAPLPPKKSSGWKIAAIVGGICLVLLFLLIGAVVMLFLGARHIKTKPPITLHQNELPISQWHAGHNALDSTRRNNGELIGNVKYPDGITGKAFGFDGKGAYVKVLQSPSLNPGEEVTIEFWMKANPQNNMDSPQGLVTSDFYSIDISNGHGGKMGIDFSINTDSTGPSDFKDTADANGGCAPVSANEWHYVAGTYDGTELRLYIDGQPSSTPTYCRGKILPMQDGSFVSFGSEDGRTSDKNAIGTRYFNGLIDEVKFYNRALSAGEVEANYENLKNPPNAK